MGKPGERKLQILQTLAGMLDTPKGEKITTAALAALRPQRAGWLETVQDAKTWLTGALEAADEVTASHDDDGIALVIERD